MIGLLIYNVADQLYGQDKPYLSPSDKRLISGDCFMWHFLNRDASGSTAGDAPRDRQTLHDGDVRGSISELQGLNS